MSETLQFVPPIERRVIRYVCPFCSRGHSARPSAFAHIARCYRNPPPDVKKAPQPEGQGAQMPDYPVFGQNRTRQMTMLGTPGARRPSEGCGGGIAAQPVRRVARTAAATTREVVDIGLPRRRCEP